MKNTNEASAYKTKWPQKLLQLYKPVSQSCAVAKSETFWRATGQSNLADKRLAATKASKVWFSYSHNCTLASGAVFHSVCQVWLSSGLPEFFTFSYCAWLLYRMTNRPACQMTFLATLTNSQKSIDTWKMILLATYLPVVSCAELFQQSVQYNSVFVVHLFYQHEQSLRIEKKFR